MTADVATMLVLLVLAPGGMAAAYWRGRRNERQHAAADFSRCVEENLRVRHRG